VGPLQLMHDGVEIFFLTVFDDVLQERHSRLLYKNNNINRRTAKAKPVSPLIFLQSYVNSLFSPLLSEYHPH
jgi:hypothetical protein